MTSWSMLLAPENLRIYYAIDNSRLYLAGFSGGGRVASMAALDYPAIFSGAIYMSGVSTLREKESYQLSLIRQNRYVFITGSGDFNRSETRTTYSAYKRAGIDNSKLIDVRNLAHELPGPSAFGKALRFLSGNK